MMNAPTRLQARLLTRKTNICFDCALRWKIQPREFRSCYSSTFFTARGPNLSEKSRKGGFKRQFFSANSSVYHGDQTLPRNSEAASQEEGMPRSSAHEIQSRVQEQIRLLDRRKNQNIKSPSVSKVPSAYPIRPDAPSRLTSLSTNLPRQSLRRRLAILLSLSKPNLSFLIVLTTAASYALYPVPPLLSSTATTSPSLSALTLVFLTSGTALCCASANTLNMLFEPEYDAKMSRTRNRPLVRGLISKRAAAIFAAVTAALGTAALYSGVNPTVAGLGALNIVLYAGVYTPMKRISVANTWVGALVGGIPPLMGWAAASGQAATGNGGPEDLLLGEKNIGAWLLAALLFAWQFPHFNALSWGIRDEYKAAGYRMLVSFKPKVNGRVALRYSILMFPICFGLSYVGVTDSAFVVTSSIANAWMVRAAVKFWRLEGHKGSARGLFWASVWHLPVVMVLAMAHKKGLWEGLWRRAFDDQEREDDGWLYEDEEDEHDGTRVPVKIPASS